jgi:hypothetical protein
MKRAITTARASVTWGIRIVAWVLFWYLVGAFLWFTLTAH